VIAVEKELFDKQKYLVIRNFFHPIDVARMAKRMHYLKLMGVLEQDRQCPRSYSIYGDPIQSEFQELYKEKLESCIGYKLFPTYTYSRIYSPKEILERHRDRPSCEISLTATLDYETFDNEPWEIYVEPGIKYKLYPGDVLVYKGCDLDHWRDMFIGVYQTQVFMHYVNANGKYHMYKYDGRPSLGSSVSTKVEVKEQVT
jgi:hypothetical protein